MRRNWRERRQLHGSQCRKGQLAFVAASLFLFIGIGFNFLALQRTLKGVEEYGQVHGNSERHQLAGLNCDRFGGPSEAKASEMVYWRDIPSDSAYTSQLSHHGPSPKFLTFEPDEGGWNNIRMSMETATVLAHAMGRILVLPPEQKMYLLEEELQRRNNRFTFKDFFHFDSIVDEHSSLQIMTMDEFLETTVMQEHRGTSASYDLPPGYAQDSRGVGRATRKFWKWLREIAETPKWDYARCAVGLPKKPGAEGTNDLFEYKERASSGRNAAKYDGNPTPVDASAEERMRELIADRRSLCVYSDRFQTAPIIHFMGDNDSGARLLTHFYSYLFFEDYRQDLWTKRFVRDHLRYTDEIQCAAARVVDELRQISREHGDPDGLFDTFHIRRGDFQYKQTRIDADQIYESIKDVLVENHTVYIATDESNMTFFEPLTKHYRLYFLRDFQGLLTSLNKNFYGMLDQLIASRGRAFVGAYFSTFTGYINRIRGYHSQKDKLAGYDMGEINSYYYTPKKHKMAMKRYRTVSNPIWAREFPIGWRDIDHDVEHING